MDVSGTGSATGMDIALFYGATARTYPGGMEAIWV